MRAALVALILAIGLAAHSFARALRLDPPELSTAPGRVPSISEIQPAAVLAHARAVAAVEKDPFHPERRRPASRFRMPGEAIAVADPASSAAPQAPVALLGTVVLPDGKSFAMCQRAGEPPRIVRLGERLGDLMLRTVAQGRAEFVDGRGERIEVRVPKSGA